MRNLPSWFWLVLAIGAGLLFYRLIFQRKPRGNHKRLFKSPASGQQLRRGDPLINALLGDADKAKRLADYEKQRNPKLTDAQARARALERLGDDRWR